MDLLNFYSPRPQRRWQSDRAPVVVDCSYYIANKKRGVKKKSRLVQRLTKFVKAANFLLYIKPKQMIYP